MSPSAPRTIGLLLALAAAPGCRTGAGEAEVPTTSLPPAPAAPTVPFRLQAEVEIESPTLRGHFDLILAAAPGAHPRLRAQLFPALGPKILDLSASTRRLEARIPQERHSLAVDLTRPVPAEVTRELAFLLGVTLLESLGPPPQERALAARRTAEGFVVRTAPLLPSIEVEVDLDPAGQVRRRRFRLGRIAFTEILESPDARRVEAEDFLLRVAVVEQREDPDLPGDLLALPPEASGRGS
jgi:hypothetical protein